MNVCTRIWRSESAHERMANMRLMRETQYLLRHFIAHPDEFGETYDY